jgi:hypothetical protein
MTSTIKITKELTEFTLVYDENENILYSRIKPNVFFDLELSQKLLTAVEEFIGLKKHKALIEMGEFNSSSDNARKFYAENEYVKKYRIADAFVLKSLSVRLIINFFIKFNKPFIPTKAFSDIDKAKAWLNSI